MDKITINSYGHHELELLGLLKKGSISYKLDTEFRYTFENFFHPFVGELITELNKNSLPGMLAPSFLEGLSERVSNPPETDTFFKYFEHFYKKPSDEKLAMVSGFPKEIDVSEHGPYANYNWELFFHIPLTIAVHLSKNQRFAEAQRWFHYIFDPTSNDLSDEKPKRFWRFLAFRENDVGKRIEDIVRILSIPANQLTTDEERDLQKELLSGYYEILKKPFHPHAVAKTRHLAYQYCVVMKYLDNLIAWGDQLFQQDTIESINEATQIYVLAANILGERPQQIPPLGKIKAKTFAQLKQKGLGPIGDALVDLEGQFPVNFAASQSGGSSGDPSALFGIGRTLYFCIPRNDKMLGYWDTVADRLFKIRHCMNIAGVVRTLALFDPPIDPGMLVKAAAAGIDVGSIVNGMNQPIGPVRSLFLVQKALELCGEVRGLGNALLAALEKGDAEHLSLIRQRHEMKLQQMTQEVRFLQFKSAQEATTSLLTSRKTALERLRYYQRLLGLSADQNAPDELTLDHASSPEDPPKLTQENFDEAYGTLVGQFEKPVAMQDYSQLMLAPQELAEALGGALQTGNLHLSMHEFLEMNVLGPSAQILRVAGAVSDAIFAALALIPDANVDVEPTGVGAHAQVAGGSKLADSGRAISSTINALAGVVDMAASYTSKAASYQRRADDWLLQYNLAAHELMQIGRQILTSLIAEQIAHHEYQNIQQQIRNAQEVDQFLHDKFTNEDLYLWMQGEISRLYYEYYRFSFDTARKAEKTMKQELMRQEVDAQDFVKFNYWDGGRKGLLSGEALYLDVKRMEMAYHDHNKRELELTKHVSLRQLNPIALLNLKATGTCQVTIPEWLYDLDGPGHYMRRIKSVALSIPSVVGPYTSVNCTLSLLKSSLRKSPLPKDGDYIRKDEDDRFVDYIGAVQSIVTSSGQNDSGMFETNLRDERFLPFEGAGAESTWKLELPKDYRAFDYDTISDVILHIRYTARQGVEPSKVKTALDELFQQANNSGLALIFNLRHDFPTEWSAFVNGAGDFNATIRMDYFPYFTLGKQKQISISGYELYGQDVTKHRVVGKADDWSAATNYLAEISKQAFTITLQPDMPGPNQILTRTEGGNVFFIVRYLVS